MTKLSVSISIEIKGKELCELALIKKVDKKMSRTQQIELDKLIKANKDVIYDHVKRALKYSSPRIYLKGLKHDTYDQYNR